MAENFQMMQEIMEEHSERISNLKKYFPYFYLSSLQMAQYKDGKYVDLDFGYLTLAVLRFFIEKNSFQDKDVVYEEYEDFMRELLVRDFGCRLSKEEEKELISYLFDKLTNEGKPFSFVCFDPADKKRKTVRVKLFDSKIEDQTVYYFITSDAIEFYLDTKEMKEESTISMEQLLLEKLIKAGNFKGGTEVVKRINHQVKRLQTRKNEVLNALSRNVFEGMKVYEEYTKSITRWFEEEQGLFEKNSRLIESALRKAEAEEGNFNSRGKYAQAVREIYELERQLKQAVQKHSSLLQTSMDLQIKAGQIVTKSKLNSLRSSFDFGHALNLMMEREDASLLRPVVTPLFDLNRKKTFSFTLLDDLLSYKRETAEKGEEILQAGEEAYIYEDELEERRITKNYRVLLSELFAFLTEKASFTLSEFQEILQEKYGSAVFKNGDYYSFLVHLTQKKEYQMQQVLKNPDTFFEEMIGIFLKEMPGGSYEELAFRVDPQGEKETLRLCGVFEISNILFQRK